MFVFLCFLGGCCCCRLFYVAFQYVVSFVLSVVSFSDLLFVLLFISFAKKKELDIYIDSEISNAMDSDRNGGRAGRGRGSLLGVM